MRVILCPGYNFNDEMERKMKDKQLKAVVVMT